MDIMFFLFSLSPKVPVSLYIYEEHWGAKIPLARLEGKKGVSLRTIGAKTFYCRIEVPDSILNPDKWKSLKERYVMFQGTDLPTYHFRYRYGDMVKEVETYGPPNVNPFLGAVFKTVMQTPCEVEVKPKNITLEWEEVDVRRKPIPAGKYEALIGKTEVKGKDYDLAYDLIKRFGHTAFTGVVLMDSKKRTWLVRIRVEI